MKVDSDIWLSVPIIQPARRSPTLVKVWVHLPSERGVHNCARYRYADMLDPDRPTAPNPPLLPPPLLVLLFSSFPDFKAYASAGRGKFLAANSLAFSALRSIRDSLFASLSSCILLCLYAAVRTKSLSRNEVLTNPPCLAAHLVQGSACIPAKTSKLTCTKQLPQPSGLSSRRSSP